MLVQEKITLGRLREAYNLASNEADALAQTLWPHAVFPGELWNMAWETCWKDLAIGSRARYKIAIPLPPQPQVADKKFNTLLFALDIQEFFRKLAFIISSQALMTGLTLILEHAYEDAGNAFKNEQEILFSNLRMLEAKDALDQYFPDSPLFENGIPAIPASFFHFITRLYPDTIVVEREAAIKWLCAYPLRREVKGITRSLVSSILVGLSKKNSILLENSHTPTEAHLIEQAEDGKLTYHIPPSIWLGLPEKAVRDAMIDDYPLPVIAYVLFNWCGNPVAGGRKTSIGRLLADEEYSDPKSYRNFVDRLLKEASTCRILQN